MAAITLVYMTEITIFFLVFVAAEYAWILGLERMSGCCEMFGRITAPDAAQHQQLAGWLQELFLLRQLVGKNSE